MYPSWLQVEYAMIFFKSSWNSPINAAKNAVKAPIIVIQFNASEQNSKIIDNLIVKYIPAVTMVAAWINAETGVGPSIESGSQAWNIIWADFDITAIKIKTAIQFDILTFQKRGSFNATRYGYVAYITR